MNPYREYMTKIAGVGPRIVKTLAGAGVGLGLYSGNHYLQNALGKQHHFDPFMAAWSTGMGAVGGALLPRGAKPSVRALEAGL